MKTGLLQSIVCPLCGGTLMSESFEETLAGEIRNGILICGACGAAYPIINGIPRLLPPALQDMLWETHPEFFRTHDERLPTQSRPEKRGRAGVDRALAAQRETARSFGYEWQAFSEMLPDYEANFDWYFERFAPASFKDQRVLDAGCGTGRHTYYMARSGAREVIAMDLSQAIEVAARNNLENPNTHFIQADIYHPPFPPESFDFIYSLGVLHHLPEPEKGFRALLPLLRADGFINIYLYWNLEGEAAWRRAALAAVTRARRVTTRLAHPLLQKISWLIAAVFHVAFVLPARALDRFSATRALADRVPLGHYRRYPFRMLYTDQFDRLSAPIENRYSRAEVAGWLERAGLKDVLILGGAGWRASGRRVVQSPAAEKTDQVIAPVATMQAEG
ncbi:MAG TPA: methyltransferase domain-containing protein [Pyrinomonadaceae bacterium]|nr:methyltransferase domain-containing protein [Pyrinomonadaceae bacterium]